MKTILNYLPLCLAAILLASCTPEEKKQEQVPEITVAVPELNLSPDGGIYSVQYTLSNPVSDGKISAVCEAGWITSVDTGSEGKVSFRVEANPETSVRESDLTIVYTYGGEETSAGIHLVQDGKEAENPDPEPDELTFDLDLICDYLEIRIKVTPSDNESKYFFALYRASELDSYQGSDSEKVLSFCKDYIHLLRQVGYTDADLISFGPVDVIYDDREPETEYLGFAVAVDDQCNPIGDPVYDFVTTPSLQFGDAKIEVSCDKYFDGDEVAAGYPEYASAAGKAVIPTEITVSGGAVGYKVQVLGFDASGLGLTQDKLLDELQYYGSSEPMVKIVPWGTTCTILGIPIDADGNFGDMFVDYITVEKDKVTDISEFFEGSDNL